MVLRRALGKTPHSRSTSHHPGVEVGTGALNVGDGTDIPLKRVRNTRSLFILRNPDKLRPNNPHLIRMQTLPLPYLAVCQLLHVHSKWQLWTFYIQLIFAEF